jgi:hypothetical protein
MSKNETIQIKAEEDGCIYIYDVAARTWQKLCFTRVAADIPESVKMKIREMQSTTLIVN